MKPNRFKMAVATALLALSLNACQAPATQISSPNGGTSHVAHLVIKAHDFTFDLPKTVASGLVDVTLENHGKEQHHAQLLRLNDGVTMAQFQAALQKGPEALLPLVTTAGGPGAIEAGAQNAEVMLNLKPGHYVVLCFLAGADQVPHLAKGMIGDFEVVPAQGAQVAEEPKADGEIKLVDFSFVLPAQIEPGKHTWKIINDGTQDHELAIMKIADGKTLDDVMKAMGSGGPAPITMVGGMTAIAKATNAWLMIDLPTGNYIATCFVPDAKTGKAHAELGMMMPFTVGDPVALKMAPAER